jgi:hypothetical protein
VAEAWDRSPGNGRRSGGAGGNGGSAGDGGSNGGGGGRGGNGGVDPNGGARETGGFGRTARSRVSAGTSSGGERAVTPFCTVGFCPICMAVAALGEVRPEFVEHLLLASREVLLAMRALIDARLGADERPAKLQKLTIE